MDEIKVVYVDVDEIKVYENNAKLHPYEQIEQIKKSIELYGMNDPLALWKNNEIIEGHGRLQACLELGMKRVPCFYLNNLTDKERREYMLVHNQTTLNSGWDFDKLEAELEELDFDGFDFGFEIDTSYDAEDDENNPYTKEINIPQYEPTGEYVEIEELVDTSKSEELIEKIKQSGVSKKEKQFLINAAYRHNIFNYKEIAEYYANASEEMQELMEDSALVIIDINDAIAKGYAVLRKDIEEIALYE